MPDEITSEQALDNAAAFFAKDDAPPTPPVATPPQTPPAPEPAPEPEKEPEPQKEPEPDGKPKTEPETFEEEFVAFEGKQKERFNSVYGTMRRFERENLTLQQQIQQLQRMQQAPPPITPAPQFQLPAINGSFSEAKPKLADFETADEWADKVADWSERRAIAAAQSRLEQQFAQQAQQSAAERTNNYINTKIAEGQKQFGLKQFNDAAKDVVQYAPHGSPLYTELFELERFPEVVIHLSKNVELADRLSSLSHKDQIYELRSLEKKLALAAKSQPKLPTKVEAPGAGEDEKPAISVPKLRQAAKASGQIRDWAKVFQSDPTM